MIGCFWAISLVFWVFLGDIKWAIVRQVQADALRLTDAANSKESSLPERDQHGFDSWGIFDNSNHPLTHHRASSSTTPTNSHQFPPKISLKPL
jgi:hypothetical protein